MSVAAAARAIIRAAHGHRSRRLARTGRGPGGAVPRAERARLRARVVPAVRRQAEPHGAARTEPGRRVRACEAAGFGLLAWSVLVDDLEAVSGRLGIEIHDYTIPHGDGTLRGWRTVSGPAHLPFFIDYPSNGDRNGRLQAMYDRVGHRSSPVCFFELTIGGSETEMLDWLGPHDLPLRFVNGEAGIRAARISTAEGPSTSASGLLCALWPGTPAGTGFSLSLRSVTPAQPSSPRGVDTA
jgi:hypothetical protein